MDILFCEYCNGTLSFLGTLGTLDHFNCQNCGLESSYHAEIEIGEQEVVYND